MADHRTAAAVLKPAAFVAAWLLAVCPVLAQDLAQQTPQAPTPEPRETQPAPAIEDPPAPEIEGEGEQPSDDVVEQPALPHPELVLGSTAEGTTSNEQSANYSFFANSPGLLTVVVRSQAEDNDLSIAVSDPDGREIESCDIDYLGNGGAEHFTVMIPAEGVYRVSVRPLGGGGAFWIGGSFIPYEGVASAASARPGDAQPLTPGTPMRHPINGQNPPGVWLSYTPQQTGFLIVETVANTGIDLQLDLYDQDSGFENYIDASDQDRRGDVSCEQISIEMQPGKTLYFHAYDRGESNRPTEVTLTARVFIEQETQPQAEPQPEPQVEPAPAPQE